PVFLSTGSSTQVRSQDALGNYGFSYDESHPTGGSFRKESGNALGQVVGSYGLRDSDGRIRTVNYIADAAGFRASISSNEPGVEPKDPAATTINKAVPLLAPVPVAKFAAPLAVPLPAASAHLLAPAPVAKFAAPFALPFPSAPLAAHLPAAPLAAHFPAAPLVKTFSPVGKLFYSTAVHHAAPFYAKGYY
ncbi:Cuticle protein 14-like isoform b, partial [Dinothrombium tinctorium]